MPRTLSDQIKVREMPLRHFTSFFFFSGLWVQGSPLPPTAQVIKISGSALRAGT
jgi:hypothetical protein